MAGGGGRKSRALEGIRRYFHLSLRDGDSVWAKLEVAAEEYFHLKGVMMR